MEIKMEISIPSDSDGYVPLQCPLCAEYFKLTPADIKADDILEIWCAYCGLKSESYLTEDVYDLALSKAKNQVADLINESFVKMTKQIKSRHITVKTKGTVKREPEEPIQVMCDALEEQEYACCKKKAKIKPLTIFTGGYCPFCGVGIDGNQ
jgi:hypothetical protein